MSSSNATGTFTLSAGTLDVNSSGALSGILAPAGGGAILDNTSGGAITSQSANPAVTLGSFTYSNAAGTANNSLNLGTGTVTEGGSYAISLNGAGVLSMGTLSQTGADTLTVFNHVSSTTFGSVSFAGYALNGNTGTILGTGNVAITGAITNGSGGASALTYGGLGTLTLSGADTYTGTTTVEGNGTLKLDFSASGAPLTNIINNVANSSGLTLGGTPAAGNRNAMLTGGTVIINGGTNNAVNNSQQFNGLTLTGNTQNELAVIENSTNTVTVTLGAIAYNGGATVDFTLPTGASLSTTTTTAMGGILTTSAAANSAVAYATANNGATWAANGSGVITAYTGYSTSYGTATNNIDVGTNDSPTAFTVNTLRFNTAGATLTLATSNNTVNTGGILVTSNETLSNPATITGVSGSILRPGNQTLGRQLTVINNGYLTIGSNVTLDQASSQTITLVIASTQGDSGTTIINGPVGATGHGVGVVITNPGVTTFNNAANLPNSSITVNAGNDTFNGTWGLNSSAITVNGGGAIFNGAVTTSAGTPVSVAGGALALNGLNTFSAGAPAVNLTNNGILSLGNSDALPTTSTVTLSNNSQLIYASNSAVNAFAISQGSQSGTGTIYMDLASGGAAITQPVASLEEDQVGSTYLFAGGNVTSGIPVLQDNGTLLYGNGNAQKGSLIAPYGVNVTVAGTVEIYTNSGSNAATFLVLDGVSTGNAITGAFTNNSGNIGNMYKTNVGTWTLSRSGNTFTGAVSIFGGTLGLNFAAGGAPASNILPTGMPLGTDYGTLALTGLANTANSQTLGNITESGGAVSFQLTAGSGIGTIGLTLGTLTHTAGGTLDFFLPSGTQSANGTTASNGVLTTTANTTSNILGAWVTVNGDADFAAVNANKSIVAYSSYTALPTSGAGSSTGVYSLAGSQNDGSALAFNAIKLTDNDASQALDLKSFSLTGGQNPSAILYAGGSTNSYTIKDSVGGASIGSSNNELILDAASGATLNIASSVQVMGSASTGALTKSGAGTVVINSTNNSYTGTNYIDQGILSIASLGTNGAGNSSVGTGGFTINGGTLQYAGAVPVSTTRAITIGGNGATLDASGVGAANTVTYGATPTFANNGNGGVQLTLTGANTGANTFAGVLGNPAGSNNGSPLLSLVKSGAGTWDLSAANTYTGPTTITGGTLALTGAGTFGAYTMNTLAPFTVNGGGTADFGGSINALLGQVVLGTASTAGTIQNGTLTSADGFYVNDGAISANLAGNNGIVGLTKNTSNTVTLSGVNTFTGPTAINAGTLKLGATGALGNGSRNTSGVTVAATGAALDLGGITPTASVPLTLNGTGISNGGALTNTSSTGATYAGLVTLGAASSIGGTGTINLSNTGTITGSGDNLTLQGAGGSVAGIIGTVAGTLTVNTTGTWTLSGANTYMGGTTVSAGTLQVGSQTALGSFGGVSVTAGAALDLNGTAMTNTNALTLNGTGISSGGALTNSGGAGTYAGRLTLGSSGVSIGGSGTINLSYTGAGAITGSSDNLTLQGAGGSVAGSIGTGAGTLTVNTTGTWTLSGANTYAGTTTISNGTLSIATLAASGAAQPLGENSTVTLAGASSGAPGILQYTGGTATLAQGVTVTNGDYGTISNTGGGVLTLSTITKNGSVLNLSGGKFVTSAAIGGSSSGSDLNVIGASTVGETVVNTYNGPTSISGGSTLLAGIAGALPTTNGNSALTLGASTDGAVMNTLDLLGTSQTVSSLTGVSNVGSTNINQIISSNGSASGTPAIGSAASTPAGSLTVNYTGGTPDTFGGSLGGTGGLNNFSLTKAGSGTLTLTGANTFGGSGDSVTVSAGTLQLGNAAALGNALNTVLVSNNAVLDLNGQAVANTNPLTINGAGISSGGALINSSATAATYAGTVALGSASSVGGNGNITLSNTISGSYGLTYAGSGTLILSGASNWSTTTTIGSGGTVQIGAGSTTGALGSSTVSDGGTLVIDLSSAYSIASGNAISGVGGLTQAGSGTTTVNSTNTYRGATLVTGGILKLGVAGALGNGTSNTSGVTVSNGAALDLNGIALTANAVALNLNGQYSSTVGALTNSNSGTPATYGGAVTLQSASSIGGAGNITLSNTISGAFGLTQVGSDTVILSGATNGSTTTAISSGGTVQIGAGSTTGALGSSTVSDGGTLVIDLSSAYSIASGNAISGVGGLTQAGSGTTTVNSTNTYRGATLVTGGILKLGVAGALGNGTSNTSGVTVSNGAALDLNGIALTANAVALNLNGQYSSTVGALTNSNSGTPATYGGAVTLQSASSIGGAGNITLSNTISGAFGLTQVGSDTVILSGATNGSTTTAISSGGTVQIGAGSTTGALGSSTVSDGGTLVIDLSSAYSIASGNAISGVGGLTQAGSGTTTVNSTNTYTGATLVTGGILKLGVAGALGSSGNNTSGVTVSNGAALDLNGNTPTANVALNLNGQYSSTVGALTNSNSGTPATYGGAVTLQSASSIGGAGNITLSNTISGAFGLTQVGSDTVILSGATNGSTATAISSGGTVQIGAGSTTGALGSSTVSDGGTLVIDLSSAYSIASGNAISGVGGLTQAGSGTTTVNSTNTYTGATLVTGGILKLGAAGALGSSGSNTSGVTVSSGAALDLNGITPTASVGLTIAGTGVSSNGALTNSSSTGATYAALVTLGGNTTIGGTGTIGLSNTGTIGGLGDNLTLQGAGGSVASIIGTGAGTLTVNTTGNWTLSGANTYSGATTVSGGTLTVGVANAIPIGSAVTIGGASTAGTLSLGSLSDSIASLSFGASGGTLSMAADDTSSAQLIASGVVALGSANTLNLTGMSTAAGFYELIQGSSITGSFSSGNVIGLATGYKLVTINNDLLEAQQQAVIALALGTNAANVRVGSQTVNLLIGNNAATEGATLNYTLGGVSGSGTVSPGSSSVPITGTYTAVAGVNSFPITASDSNASNTPLSVDFSQTGYNYASPTLNTSSPVAFGFVHEGATAPTRAVSITNAMISSYQDSLDASATTDNLAVTGNGFTAQAAGSTGSLTLMASTSAAGSLASNVTLNYVSDANGVSGLSNETLTPGSITTTGEVYSGLSKWNTNGDGSWGTLAGAGAGAFGLNWGVNQGSPGLDSGFKTTDTATFDNTALTPGSSATVPLDGASPSLAGITFSTATGGSSYTIAQGTGSGTLTLNGGSGAASVTDSAGSHTISAPVTLATNANVIVTNSADSLTISGVIGDNSSGYGLTMSGGGTLTLSGATNTFTGGVTINGGTLQLGSAGALNSTAGSENAVAFGAASTGALSLNGNSVVIASLNSNATPGAPVVQNANSTAATLTIGNSKNANSTFAGVIQDGTGGGALSVVKAGSGTTTLSGANTYTGTTTVNAGTLIVSGGISGSGLVSVTAGNFEADSLIGGVVAVTSGGELSGNGGAVGGITTEGGTVAPGLTVGSAAAGTLAVNGNVSLDPTANFNIRVGVATASDNDSLTTTTGTVNLNGANLVLTAGSNYAAGTLGLTYIILYGGANAPTGIFGNVNGLVAINYPREVNPDIYQIVYDYTDPASRLPNDVAIEYTTLTSVPEPGTWGMLLGGLATLIAIQRRRRKL